MNTAANDDMILELALEYVEQGHPVALATVVETWGSSPRPVGAQLAIRGDGVFMGSVSGGCVEGAVVGEAQEALQDGKCRLLEYGVSDEEVFAVGLACGGNIRVLVEPIGIGLGPSVAVLQYLAGLRAARKPVAYCVDLESWDRAFVQPDDPEHDLTDRFAKDRSGVEGSVFCQIYNPPLRLALVGAVHIAQTLVPLARMAGYEVTLIDPRESFASKARFPDQPVVSEWPDEALRALKPDARTAVVTLSHDPKIDTPALEVALRSEAFYIGALGSRRTHGKRVSALTDLGFEAAQIDRIHGPVGLNIGAATPAEIAPSIMAEITETLRQPKPRP